MLNETGIKEWYVYGLYPRQFDLQISEQSKLKWPLVQIKIVSILITRSKNDQYYQ